MKLFLRDQLPMILMNIVQLLLIVLVLWVSGFQEIRLSLYALFLGIVLLIIYLIYRYFSLRPYYQRLSDSLAKLDEVFEPLDGAPVSSALSDLLRKQHRLYIYEIEKAESRKNEHVNFINQWVHQMKTPLSIIELMIQDTDDEQMLSIREETDKLEKGLEMVLYAARLEVFERDFHIQEERVFALEYGSLSENEQEEEHIHLIESQLNSIPYQKYFIPIKKVSIPLTATDYAPLTGIISESSFNVLAEAGGLKDQQVNLDVDETAYLYYDNGRVAPREAVEETREVTIKENELNQTQAIGSILIRTYENYFIVDDAFFEEITADEMEAFYAFQVDDWKETADIGEQLYEDLGVSETGGFSSRFYFADLGYDWSVRNQSMGAVLFIGLFIGIIFFVSAGSFLYFRLYADIENEQQKFSMINKIGLTGKELSKVLTTQLALLFFIPIIMAVLNGAVALTALTNLFDYNMMGSSILVLATFSVIQVIYFIFIRHNYIGKIKNKLTN